MYCVCWIGGNRRAALNAENIDSEWETREDAEMRLSELQKDEQAGWETMNGGTKHFETCLTNWGIVESE